MLWKQKAVELLAELDFVRQGHIEPAEYFGRRDFVDAFKGIMVQYLQDIGYSAPEQELRACLLIRRMTFETIHGVELSFTGQATEAQWIAEAVALASNPELIKSDLIRTIIQIAKHLEGSIIQKHTVSAESQPSIEELLERFER